MSLQDPFDRWLAQAEQRYLADLTRPELGRALRALTSCYIERRNKLGSGHALDGRGKRAAFALYYAPLHFLTVRAIAREQALRPLSTQPDPTASSLVLDVGCGTGAAGAAWALATGAEVRGTDVNMWAVAEAEWTYRAFGLRGSARRGDVSSLRLPARPSTVLAAFVVNELPATDRATALDRLVEAARHGHQVVVVEPIARTLTPWWSEWERVFVPWGGRTSEWRFRVELPRLLRDLDKSAGLDHRELTARTLMAGSEPKVIM
jgi:SAM-dependent methyltransferase